MSVTVLCPTDAMVGWLETPRQLSSLREGSKGVPRALGRSTLWLGLQLFLLKVHYSSGLIDGPWELWSFTKLNQSNVLPHYTHTQHTHPYLAGIAKSPIKMIRWAANFQSLEWLGDLRCMYMCVYM